MLRLVCTGCGFNSTVLVDQSIAIADLHIFSTGFEFVLYYIFIDNVVQKIENQTLVLAWSNGKAKEFSYDERCKRTNSDACH